MFEATDARIAHPTETPEISRCATFAGSAAPGRVAGLVTAVAAVAVTVTALTSTPTAFASPTVSDLVNQIDEANYTRLLDERLYTRSGDDRGYGPEHDLARDNIVEEFNALGLDVSLHGFPYRGETYYNVQAVQDGYGRTNEVFIIGAHYDSVNNPGADDNASGVAGVIEIARVLSQYTFEASIVYIAFDREEQGLYGSSAWVNDYRETDIRGMISLDMIAYDPFDRDRALLYGSSASNPLKDDLADAMLTYGGIAAFDDGRGDFSDHAPFERRGFQACLLIEYDVWSNPHYHRQSDTIDTPNYINYGFATQMTKGVAGWLATQAGLIDLGLAAPIPGIAGLANTFTVVDATPGSEIYFVYGDSNGGQFAVPGCPGVSLDIQNPTIAGTAVADNTEVATLVLRVPEAAAGRTVYLQAVDPLTCEVSNVVEQTF